MNRMFIKMLTKNKKIIRSLLSILVLNLALFIFIIVLSIITNYYDVNIKNALNNRTIAFYDKEHVSIDWVNKHNEVERLYQISTMPVLVENQYVIISNINEFNEKKVTGDHPQNGNEIVVSNTFKKFLNGNEMVSINGINFKIVGTYELNDKKTDTIFINSEIADKIIDSGIYKAVITDYDYVDSIINKLKEYNIDANIFDDSGIKELNKYEKIFTFSRLVIIVIIMILTAINYMFINDIFGIYKKQIALFKTFGYRNIHITFHLLFGVIISYITEYILLLPLFFIKGWTNSFLTLLVIDIMLLLFNFIVIYIKLKKISIIKLFKE